MKVGILDYSIGNLGSVINVVTRLGAQPVIVSAPADLSSVDRIVLPGVGNFDTAMRHLRDTGLCDALQTHVIERKKPLLGICLGMQILGTYSEEGGIEGLGWLPGRVVRFGLTSGGQTIRVPHIGWNAIKETKPTPLLAGLPDLSEFYFVHSYHFDSGADSFVTAECEYGLSFPAMVQRENIFGAQFHPEKSQEAGEKIFENFLAVT